MDRKEINVMEEHIFLTSSQAAKLLNISTSTLKKFITIGKVRTIKTPGGHHRILKEDLLNNLFINFKEG